VKEDGEKETINWQQDAVASWLIVIDLETMLQTTKLQGSHRL